VPLGHSVAITDTVILAGRPSFGGTVLVLDAKTGAQRRVLRTSLPLFSFDDFGRSIAASGNLALIGAPAVDGRGAAYLMNISTGAVVRRLQPVTVAPGDRFGDAVAMTGRYLVVGVPSTDDTAGVNQGAVYVFDALNGNLLHRLLAPDATMDDGFGYSVAVSGHYIAVGAPGKNSSQGRVYVFDAVSGLSLGVPDPLVIAAGNKYGNAVAISGGKLLAGAPNAGGGSGLLVVQDISTGTVLHTESWVGGYGRQIVAHGRFFAVSAAAAGLSMVNQGVVRVFEATYQPAGAVPFRQVGQFVQPAPVATGEFLGTSIALNDDTLVAGSPGRTHVASVVGSIVKFGPLTSQLDTAVDAPGHREVARRGQGTPDRAGTAFDSFTQLALAPSSALTTPRLVMDAGLNGRRAAWGSDTNLDGHLFTLARSGDTFSAGVAVTDFINPIANDVERSLALARLSGPGVTAVNNEAVLMSIQRSSFAMLRKGDLVSGVPVTRLGQPRMSTTGFVALNAKVNTGGSNDSGFLVYDNNGTYLGNRTEGSVAPGLGASLASSPTDGHSRQLRCLLRRTANDACFQSSRVRGQHLHRPARHGSAGRGLRPGVQHLPWRKHQQLQQRQREWRAGLPRHAQRPRHHRREQRRPVEQSQRRRATPDRAERGCRQWPAHRCGRATHRQLRHRRLRQRAGAGPAARPRHQCQQ